jgi:hypothetical protein
VYPYLIGSDINIEKKYNVKNNYIVLCPTNSKFKKRIIEAIEHGQ